MAADETYVQSDLRMDRGLAVGNSEGPDQRRQLHVKSFDFGAVLPDQQYDACTCVQVNGTTVAFQLRNGGLLGTIVQTVTIVYDNPTTRPFVSALYT